MRTLSNPSIPLVALALVFALGACKRDAPKPTPSPPRAPSAEPAPAPTRAPPAPAPPPAATPFADAGKSACARAIVADAGGAVTGASCAATARHVYCIDTRGNVERRARERRAGEDDQARALAVARPGSPIAAADFGAHEIAVFLAARSTREGTVLHAFASIDGAPPVRVSEDGAGATSVDVAPRGASAVVAYLDARGAMVPVHARVVSDVGGSVALGKDVVVFVGGAPDPYVAGALGTTQTEAFFVLPIARDATTFGMAIVKIDDPPREEEPVTWAMYPYGLDPAPIALTHGASPIRIARVLPRSGGLGAPRAVELGLIDEAGAYRSLGVIAERDACTRVALAVEPGGTLLLTHADADDTTTERLRCPLGVE